MQGACDVVGRRDQHRVEMVHVASGDGSAGVAEHRRDTAAALPGCLSVSETSSDDSRIG